MNGVSAGRAGRREWIGLAVLTLPAMLISMDLTVLHLAVPALSAELKPGSAQLLWIVDIYGFMIAGSLITMGTLGDRIGRRRLLLIGATAFAVASVLAAFSTSATMLIVTRAVLGVAGATLMPSTMSLIRTMFPDPGQRTVAIGLWISSFSVGAAIGPLVGGLMLEYFWWGSVFLLAVPVMALLLTFGPVLLPEFRDPGAGRLDLLSAGLSLVSVLLVIYGVKQIAEHGLGGLPALTIVAGLVAGLLFLARQRILADPLIDTGLFANRPFSASLVTNTIGIFAIFGVFLFIPQYYQLVAGLSPLEAGLWSVPGAIVSVVGSMLAPMLVRWVRPWLVVCGGLAIAVVGFGLLTQIGPSSLPIVVVACFVMMAGFGMVVTLTSDMIIAAAPEERAGAASAISETGTELGGALGIAVLGSVGTAVYRREVADAVPAGVPLEAAATARDTLGGAVGVAGQLSDQFGLALRDASRAAFVDGFQLVAMCGVVIMIGLTVLAGFWLRQEQADPESAGHSAPTPDRLVAECACAR
jgi:MFS transporter, DHA2 family, multidrug resistance protein